MGDAIQISKWRQLGLPSDDNSCDSALIAHKSHSYPLFIDPQGMAVNWLIRAYSTLKIKVVSIQSDTLMKEVADSIQLGIPILITNIEETIERQLDPILQKDYTVEGNRLYLQLGDDKIFVHKNRLDLFFTSKTSNPKFSPDIFIRTAVINFVVSNQGVEDLLLNHVARLELKELEQYLSEF